jgi:hypothetical protein
VAGSAFLEGNDPLELDRETLQDLRRKARQEATNWDARSGVWSRLADAADAADALLAREELSERHSALSIALAERALPILPGEDVFGAALRLIGELESEDRGRQAVEAGKPAPYGKIHCHLCGSNPEFCILADASGQQVRVPSADPVYILAGGDPEHVKRARVALYWERDGVPV